MFRMETCLGNWGICAENLMKIVVLHGVGRASVSTEGLKMGIRNGAN